MGRKEQRGVSPVVGVILMVAIAVILSGIVFVFFTQIADSPSEPANAAVSSDSDSITLLGTENAEEIHIVDEDGTVIEILSEPGDTATPPNGEYTVIAIDSKGNQNVLQTVSITAGLSFTQAPEDLEEVHSNMEGSGTSSDPYVITNAHELQAMEEDKSAHYILGNDIDARGTEDWNDGSGFDPVGEPWSDGFVGSLDGQSYEITGLTINRPGEWAGIFEYTEEDAQVQSILLTDVDVRGDGTTGVLFGRYGGDGSVSDIQVVGGTVEGSGTNVGGIAGATSGGTLSDSHTEVTVIGGDSVGGLIGHNSAEIYNSYATGDVDGDENSIGGLVGHNFASGLVSNSYATGNVEGDHAVGGLTGRNFGAVSDSYSTGEVKGGSAVGGLIGAITDESEYIRYSYATGTVEGDADTGGLIGEHKDDDEDIVYSSYWDSSDSGTGQESSAVLDDSYGLSTDEMTGSDAESNMDEFDWDNTWTTVVDPDDYPELQWEN